MPGLFDNLYGGGQQDTYGQGGGLGGMSNSLIGLGMGLLQPYNPWAGTNAWSNALQGYQAGAAMDQRTRAQQQELAMQRERMAMARAQMNREPEAIRQLRIMGIDPTSQQARDLIYPRTTTQWHYGQLPDPDTERQYPYAFNPNTGEEKWPMGKPPFLQQ